MIKGTLRMHLGTEQKGLCFLKAAKQRGKVWVGLFSFLVDYYQKKSFKGKLKIITDSCCPI